MLNVQELHVFNMLESEDFSAEVMLSPYAYLTATQLLA
jgi:hypothetical protein